MFNDDPRRMQSEIDDLKRKLSDEQRKHQETETKLGRAKSALDAVRMARDFEGVKRALSMHSIY
jgi:predicted  nucleic acid-binding Zn-ribbon protein